MLFKLKIVWHYLSLKFRLKFKSRTALEKYQKQAFKSFVVNVLRKSKAYQDLAKSHFNFNDYSTILKADYLAQFNQINTVGIELELAMEVAIKAERSRDFTPEIDGISVGLSTGTSGKRGIFLVSENERAAWTAMVLDRVIKPKLFRKQKVAFFLRANNNLYTSVNSSLFEFTYFDIFKPIDVLAQQLLAYQPDVLAGQPSVLMDLCQQPEMLSKDLKVKKLISFAEVLEPDVKIKLQDFFKASITEVYQCTEGFLGVSCKAGVIHLNEDIIYVEKEVIDGRRFYPIITDFSRSSQPIVRYKLDDILVEMDKPCLCGSPFIAIEKIVGRADDTLIFNVNGTDVHVYADLICRRIALTTANFMSYQIVQSNNTSVQLFLQSEEKDMIEAAQTICMAIISLLEEKGIQDVNVITEDWTNRKQDLGGKFRRVIRLS